MKKIDTSSQSGSAMIYIFIAVALFAALSFTVSQMMTGGQATPKSELANIQAAEVMQFSDALRRAVNTLKIRGFDSTEISFDGVTSLTGYENSNCGADECQVFSTDGGGVIFQAPDEKWFDDDNYLQDLYGNWYFPSGLCVVGVGSDTTETCHSDGDDNEDIVAILPWIHKTLCLEINDQLDIPNPGREPPQLSGASNAWPTGDDKYDGSTGDDTALNFDTHRKGCFQGATGGDPGANTYHYFHVLWGL